MADCALCSTVDPDDATRATARQLGEQGIEAYWAEDYKATEEKLDKAYRFIVPKAKRSEPQLGLKVGPGGASLHGMF
ncbi:MAG: hypothetical protein JWN04_3474 [Myxococcaceae bacterium]|nr:hypothetical protein [Myxococcaceae bacterium]